MDTADALVETVQSLWPSAEATVARSRRNDPTVVAEFAVVPHLRSPRLLVPTHDARAAAQALCRFNSAASVRETWGRAALAAGVRSGGVLAFADRIQVHGRDDGSLAEHLSGLLGEATTFSLGIGTARVNRKPVLQVFGERGRSRGFAKLGNSRQARTDVRAEAASLDVLGERSWRTLSLPRLLHHGTWSGMEVLVMSALATSPWQRPRDQWRLPLGAMEELADAFAAEPGRLADLPWLARQRGIAADLSDAGLGEEYAAAIDSVLARHADAIVEVGAWHGDWTPWNMARRGRLVQLWDWERFEQGVPRGLDACHYGVNAVTRRDGASPGSIIRGLELAGAARPGQDTDRRLPGGLYLLAAAGRYLPLISAEAGRHIAARARTTLDALHTWNREDVRNARS